MTHAAGSRREPRRSRPGARRLVLATALAASSLAVTLFRAPALLADPPAPNIVVILTDDQRWDTLWAMPTLQAELVGKGTLFNNAFVANSLCCPSRASILTGKYSHSNLVYGNNPPQGGFTSFDDASTVATWLQASGYHTGMLGKYLNGYSADQISYIPPGWDRWFGLTQRTAEFAYYNYTVSDQGVPAQYGSQETDYLTDVLAGQADQFIRDTDHSQPLFLYLALSAPHAPAIPPPRYATAFSDLEEYRPPSYDESDMSDKPLYMQSQPPLKTRQQRSLDALRIDQYRTLLALDDAINTVLTALTETGRLSDTLIVFASDNGQTWAEHRWKKGKIVPYEESIRIPLIIRYDPLTQLTPRTDDHLVVNIDFAPTLAELAGVLSPAVDGLSLVPLISETPVDWRSDFLIEHLKGVDKVPTYCAVRSEGYLYVTYETWEEELYDLALDPYELDNKAMDSAYAQTIASLRTRLQQLCDPVPHKFTWPYDALPPSVPQDLVGVPFGPTEVDLEWAASSDNVGVTGYTIYRDGAQLAVVNGETSYADLTAEPDTTYTYTVDAFDAAGNYSAQSEPVIVTTPP